jgi:uncharacterized membrane protein YgcG
MQIRVDALGRSFTGKVVRFTRNVSLETRTMETEVDVPNNDLSITPGMYANTYLQLAHRNNVLTIPLEAIQGDGDTVTVAVLDPQNHVEMRNIQVGLRGSTLVQVVSGLQEGERVILGDTSAYKPGEVVTPRPQPEPANDVMHEEGGMTDVQTADDANGSSAGIPSGNSSSGSSTGSSSSSSSSPSGRPSSGKGGKK